MLLSYQLDKHYAYAMLMLYLCYDYAMLMLCLKLLTTSANVNWVHLTQHYGSQQVVLPRLRSYFLTFSWHNFLNFEHTCYDKPP